MDNIKIFDMWLEQYPGQTLWIPESRSFGRSYTIYIDGKRIDYPQTKVWGACDVRWASTIWLAYWIVKERKK